MQFYFESHWSKEAALMIDEDRGDFLMKDGSIYPKIEPWDVRILRQSFPNLIARSREEVMARIDQGKRTVARDSIRHFDRLKLGDLDVGPDDGC